MNYYISDLHFLHTNVIKFDNRPFDSIEEMTEILINNWNSVVSKNDTVYILGDFCWAKEDEWIKILNRLNGSKCLILGNHDLRHMTAKVKKYFTDIKDYKEITDNGRKILMSHYPMIFYKSDWNRNIYHLYGHLHNTWEEEMIQDFKQQILEKDERGDSCSKCQFYNCWCGFYEWKPVTLDQIIERWK